MATTTNYAWETPDDTDLVKDGALAIRTLGSSIDTTTKALNPSTTLGDIEYRSSTADTNSRLAIGTNGQVLTVASGVPSWATSSSGGMTLLSTTSLSSTSTSISIGSGYKDIEIWVKDWYASSGVNNVMFGFNSDSTSSNYRYAGVGIVAGSNAGLWSGNSSYNFSRNNPAGANNENSSVFRIYDYLNTNTYKVGEHLTQYKQNGNNYHCVDFAKFCWQNTSAITSIQFFHEVGGVTWSGGTVEIYGVK
jgi:hypothetical protein